MIKLIACDMDGTLLDDNKKIDEEIYDILPKLWEKNIRFIVASGRQYPSLVSLFQKQKEEVVIVAENGAFVVHNDKEIYSSVMSNDFMRFCVDKISAIPHVTPLVCGKHSCYTSNPKVCAEMSSDKFKYDIKLVEDLYHVPDEVIKVSLIDEHEAGAGGHSYLQLAPLLAGKGEIAVSGFGCLDIVNLGVSKGGAILELQKKWGISPSETMAFGDSYNDVEMLAMAKYSFAMEGAEDGVKKYAKFIAGSNNKGGVVKEIRRLIE